MIMQTQQILYQELLLHHPAPEGPIAGGPVEVVQRQKPVAVRRDEVDGGEDELELLPREVVGEAHPRPSRLHAMVALVEETNSALFFF